MKKPARGKPPNQVYKSLNLRQGGPQGQGALFQTDMQGQQVNISQVYSPKNAPNGNIHYGNG